LWVPRAGESDRVNDFKERKKIKEIAITENNQGAKEDRNITPKIKRGDQSGKGIAGIIQERHTRQKRGHV